MHKKKILKKLKSLINETFFEIKKIIWPSPKETLQITFIVIIITIITSSIIWGLDQIILKTTYYIINLNIK